MKFESLTGYMARAAALLRIQYFTLLGVKFGAGCLIGRATALRCGSMAGHRGDLSVGAEVRISDGVIVDCYGGEIEIADRVHLGPYTVIYGHGGVSIGEDTLIAMHCCIVAGSHTIPARDRRIRWEPDRLLPVKIGRDVWLGAGVKVLPGVTIGDGSVIGAGSVVTRDIPPYSVAAGVPARVLRER